MNEPAPPETNRPATAREEGRARARYGVVMVLLLATFVFLMLDVTATWGRAIVVVLQGMTLLAALAAAEVRPRTLRISAILVAFAFALSILGVIFHGDVSGGFVSMLEAILVAVAPVVIARSAVRRGLVDVRTVMAALCIYVLFGMFWAFVFQAIGSFGSHPFFVQQPTATTSDYLYFSFVTQTTVGYGDYTAATNLGRSGAVLDALLGQIYLVTVVAVLVSRLRPRHPAPDQSA